MWLCMFYSTAYRIGISYIVRYYYCRLHLLHLHKFGKGKSLYHRFLRTKLMLSNVLLMLLCRIMVLEKLLRS